MKRIVNYRPLCIFVLFQVLGIILATKIDSLYWLRTLLILLSLAVFVLLFFTKLKRFIYIPVALLAGLVLMFGVIDSYNAKALNLNNADIYATISSEIIEGENSYYFTLTNLNVDGITIKGSATVFYKDLPNERAGQNIKINGNIKSLNFDIFDGYFVANYRKGIYYTVNATDCSYIGEGALPFSLRYRLSVKKKLYQYTDENTAEICSALLFGDKFGISDTLYSNIRASGLAHIFAVSGLHIGIIAFFIIWIFSKLKLKKQVQFILTVSILLLYGYLCGFPASVVRAIVMVAVYLLADRIGEKKDNISSLCFAGIIVLLLNPVDMFSAGFLMSFGAVFGIFVLAKPIEERLSFLPKSLNQIISVSIAVNIMLYPIMAHIFGEFQTLFLIANILILPILPFIYPIMLVMCNLVQLIPHLAPMLVVLNFLTLPIKLISWTLGSMAVSVVEIGSLKMFSILYYFLIVLFSRYVFLTAKTKVKIGCYMTVLFVFTLGIVSVF